MTDAQIALFQGPGRSLELTGHPVPSVLRPGELLVRIRLATLCGSDLHTRDGRRQEPAPSILGHEALGEVIAIGTGRTEFEVGDRVTWSLADSCGLCAPCTEWDLPQKCDRLFKYGHAALSDGSGLNGCYASHLVVRAGTTVLRVPGTLPDSHVVPANCALATMVCATETLPKPCRVAVIQGAGLLGLYGCALLKARGVGRVIVVDTQPNRLRRVADFGGEPALQSALATAPVGRTDAVFEVAGTPEVLAEGIRLLRFGGHYTLLGMVHPASALALTGETVIRKCLTLRGHHNYAPRHLVAALEFLDRHRDDYPWSELVSPPFPLDEIEAAFQEARRQNWPRVSIRP